MVKYAFGISLWPRETRMYCDTSYLDLTRVRLIFANMRMFISTGEILSGGISPSEAKKKSFLANYHLF
ncbi:hypothetical protein AWV79_02430 [Cupriavidus sp. UYMMa02A]|nr:hypothetical protein AWV79_02430 [Cupriavidus sp. UYMMa02A]